MTIINGTFTSFWSENSITTPATLNTETGEITTEPVDVDGDDLGILETETFDSDDGVMYQVCTNCHSHVLRVVMEDDQVGNGISETLVCSNPNCEE